MNRFTSKKNRFSMSGNEKDTIICWQKALHMLEIVQAQAVSGNWTELQRLTEEEKIPDCGAMQILKPENQKFMYRLVAFFSVLNLFTLYILCFSLFTCVATERYQTFSIGFLIVFTVFLILNTAWITYAVNEIQFTRRWEKYVSIFRHRNMEFLGTMVAYTGYKEAIIRKDLKAARRKGIIAQGYFLNGGTVFSLSQKGEDVPVDTSEHGNQKEEKMLYSEISALKAECEGKIEISQLIDKIPKKLLHEIQDIQMQYCYEIKAHMEIRSEAELLLKAYIETIDCMLYDGADTLLQQKSLDTNRQQILKNVNAVFQGALTELCCI